MKFKITSKTPDGSVLTHIYDNLTLDITTEEGIPVYLDQDPRLVKFQKKGTKRDKNALIKDSEDVSLRITLGFDCNFHCKYCIENNVVLPRLKKDKKVIPITPLSQGKDERGSRLTVEERAKALVNKLAKNIKSIKNICFWGGEPLVYLKQIKALMPLLREAYPETEFSCITNGSLVTKEVAQYLLDNKIQLTLSHDGPSFTVYRDDVNPLENPKTLEGLQYYAKEAIKQGKQLHVNVVVTPDNADLSELHPYFSKYFGDTGYHLNFEGIVKLSQETAKIIKLFDKETKNKLITQLVAYGSTPDNNHPYNSIRNIVSQLVRRLVHKYVPPMSCFIRNAKDVAVDMDGNLLVCHGSSETFGTLDTIKTSTFPDKKMSYWADKEKCKKCPVLFSCLGQCIMAPREDLDVACDNYLIWHSGVFLAAWKLLFGSLITRIEPLEED